MAIFFGTLFFTTTTGTPTQPRNKQQKSQPYNPPKSSYATCITATLKINMQREARETLHILSLPVQDKKKKAFQTLDSETKNLPKDNNKTF